MIKKQLFNEFSKEWRKELNYRLDPETDYEDVHIDLNLIDSALTEYLESQNKDVWKGLTGQEKNEKTLQYLLPLLKNNELVMLVYRYDKNLRGYRMYRLSTPETAEEDIDILRKEWNLHPDGIETLTWFVLPKNRQALEKLMKSDNETEKELKEEKEKEGKEKKKSKSFFKKLFSKD